MICGFRFCWVKCRIQSVLTSLTWNTRLKWQCKNKLQRKDGATGMMGEGREGTERGRGTGIMIMLRRQLFGCGEQLYPLKGMKPEPGRQPLPQWQRALPRQMQWKQSCIQMWAGVDRWESHISIEIEKIREIWCVRDSELWMSDYSPSEKVNKAHLAKGAMLILHIKDQVTCHEESNWAATVWWGSGGAL